MSWTDTPKSSAIQRFAYDEQSSKLTVHFRNGGVYDYHGVLPHHFEAFRTADSHGTHLAKHIAGKHKSAKRSESS